MILECQSVIYERTQSTIPVLRLSSPDAKITLRMYLGGDDAIKKELRDRGKLVTCSLRTLAQSERSDLNYRKLLLDTSLD